MKNRKQIMTGLIGVLLSTSVFSQKEKSESVLTVAIGDGGFGTTGTSFNAMYDYAFYKRFSVGGALNFIDLSSKTYPKGNLTRSNAGVRMLFHLGGKTNWDIYAGHELGITYWSGSGIYNEGSLLGFISTPRKNGDTDYSLQGLIGARYLVKDWIGINTELAIGNVYTYRLGISCKLSNTKNGYTAIKDAYAAEIVPAQKKNIVKVQMGGFVLGPGISYERYLKNRFSVEVGSSVKFYSALAIQFNNYSQTSNLVETDSLHKGVLVYGMFKHYVTAKKNAFPKGLYLGAGYNYSTQTTLVHVQNTNAIPSTVSFDYEKTVESHTARIVGGYQLSIANHFTIDAMAGVKFGTSKLKSMRYIDPQANEEGFAAEFGSHQLSFIDENPLVFRLSFGFMF